MDPDGNFAHIIIAAAVGHFVGGVTSFIGAMRQGKSAWGVIKATWYGAQKGAAIAAAGAAGGPWAAAGAAATFATVETLAAGGSVKDAFIQGNIAFGISIASYGVGSMVSGATGAAANGISNSISSEAGKAVVKHSIGYATSVGMAYGTAALTGGVNDENWDDILINASASYVAGAVGGGIGEATNSRKAGMGGENAHSAGAPSDESDKYRALLVPESGYLSNASTDDFIVAEKGEYQWWQTEGGRQRALRKYINSVNRQQENMGASEWTATNRIEYAKWVVKNWDRLMAYENSVYYGEPERRIWSSPVMQSKMQGRDMPNTSNSYFEYTYENAYSNGGLLMDALKQGVFSDSFASSTGKAMGLMNHIGKIKDKTLHLPYMQFGIKDPMTGPITLTGQYHKAKYQWSLQGIRWDARKKEYSR